MLLTYNHGSILPSVNYSICRPEKSADQVKIMTKLRQQCDIDEVSEVIVVVKCLEP